MSEAVTLLTVSGWQAWGMVDRNDYLYVQTLSNGRNDCLDEGMRVILGIEPPKGGPERVRALQALFNAGARPKRLQVTCDD